MSTFIALVKTLFFLFDARKDFNDFICGYTIYKNPRVRTCIFPHYPKLYMPINCSWSDKAPMSPKRILNVDLSYLPKRTEIFFPADFGK